MTGSATVISNYSAILAQTVSTTSGDANFNQDAADFAALLDAGTLTTQQVQDALLATTRYQTVEGVIRIYQAAFNRQPDSAGLSFWVNAIEAGTATLDTVGQSFTATTEFTTRYPAANSGSSAYVVALYNNVLGRAPDTAGLNFWTTNIGNGTATTADLLNSFAGSTEFQTNTDSTIATLVEAVADGGAFDTTAPVGTTGTSGVTGETFTLTANIDDITGTAGNDIILGDAATATTADQINGGDGTDTVRIFGAAAASDLGTQTNVEILELIGSTTGFTVGGSATSVVFDDPTTGQTWVVGAGVASTVKNVANGEAVAITNAATTTTGSLTTSSIGTTATATINFDAAALSTINLAVEGASLVALVSTGTVTAVNITGTSALTLDLTGETSVVSVGASEFTGNATIDLGASVTNTSVTTGTGNDTVTAVAAVNYTIDLGAGDDTLITADAAGETTATDTLAGGDGTDTLGIAAAEAAALDDGDAADIAVLAKITGFEQLRITDDLAADINVANLGFNYIQLADDVSDGAGTTPVAITGVTSGATIELRDAANMTDNLVVGMTNATGAGTNDDTLNLLLNADLTVNDTSYTYNFDLQGINIINITANDRGAATNPDTDANGQEGYVVDLAAETAGNSANISTVNIAGAQQVSYTVNAATTALATVNAADATGNIIVDGTAFAGTQGLSITSGAGIDTLTGSDLGDILVGGAGNDTIDGEGGIDTLTGGAGNDTFTIVSTEAAANGASFESITDFATGDLIDLSGTALTISGDASTTATATNAAINAEGIASFATADDTLAERIAAVNAALEAGTEATGQIAVFEFDGNSYVYIYDDTADTVAAQDSLIQLTGVTGLTNTTIVAGDLTIA